MPVQDDDPYEDEEEEDQESDELVVVEDKPYISHKQAQSVRLLGILENIERRVCFAPRAPHLTLPPGAPGASEPSRPRTSPFLPSRPGSKDGKTKCPKAMRAAAYYSSRPTTVGTGSDAGTRPATVDSKRNQTPGMTRITSPVKPQWVWASGTSIYRQAQHRHFHDILMTPAKVRRLSTNVYPLLMASHSFSRERLRRVLRKKAAVILHLHTFTSADLDLHTFTPADLDLHTFTPADLHLHTLTSADLDLHTFTSADLDLHTFTPADLDLHTFTPADLDLHTFTPADLDLHTFTPADLDLHTLTSADLDLHTLTSADLDLHTFTSADLDLHTLTPADLDLHTFTSADLDLHTLTPADLDLHRRSATKRNRFARNGRWTSKT